MGYSYDVTCNVFKWKQENIPVLQLEEMCTGIATKPRLQLESQKKKPTFINAGLHSRETVCVICFYDDSCSTRDRYPLWNRCICSNPKEEHNGFSQQTSVEEE